MRINKKIKRLLYYFFVFIIIIIFLTLVYVFFTNKNMYITKVVILPNDYSNRFAQVIEPILGQKRFYFIPSSHTVFIPKSAINKAVKTQYPEIKTIVITHKGFKTIEVSAELRTALFRLDNGLAVDVDGVVYQEPKDISNLPLLIVKVNLPLKEKLEKISSFAKKISSSLNKVDYITIDENGDILYFLADSRDKAYIITTLKDDTETLWSTFISAASTDPLEGLLTSSKEKLSYIDLRFGNKVFYKFGKYASIASTTKDSIIATTTSVYDTRILAEPNR